MVIRRVGRIEDVRRREAGAEAVHGLEDVFPLQLEEEVVLRYGEKRREERGEVRCMQPISNGCEYIEHEMCTRCAR